MKKLLLTGLLCIGLGTSVGHAISVDDLDGKIGGVIYGSNFAQGNLTHITENDLEAGNYHFQNFRHYGVKFEKISSTRVRIVGMWEGFDICATLNSNGQLTLDTTTYGKDEEEGEELTICPTSWNGYTIEDYIARSYNNYLNGSTLSFDGYMHWYPLFSGEVQSNAYKELSSLKNVGVFQFTNNETAYRIPSNGAAGNFVFTSIQLFVFESNATAYRLDANNNIIDTFGMRLTPEESGSSIEMLNWNNLGLNYQNVVNNKTNGYINTFTQAPTYNQISCSVSGDNLTIPFQKEAGMVGGISKDYGTFYCHYLFNETADSYKRGNGTGIWFQENTNLWNANSFISGSADQTDITGTRTADLTHAFDDIKWTETDGGNLKTFDSPIYVFGPSKIMYLSGTTFAKIEYSGEVNKTIIIPDGATEITHSATFEIGSESGDYSYVYFKKANGEWNKSLTLNGTITNRENCQHVESYDLYVIPKNVGTADTWASTEHDSTKGHAQGVCIATGLQPQLSRSSNADIPVKIALTGDEVPALNTTGNNTFYLKANYTKASGLHSTFHSLVNKPITTAIETIDMGAKEVKINAGASEIEVSGAEKVEVYTLSGVQVYAGGEGTVAVSGGIYVVKADGVVRKVTVK